MCKQTNIPNMDNLIRFLVTFTFLYGSTNAGIDYGAKQSCDRAPAKMDAAWLTIVTNDPVKHMPELTLYAQMDVCYKCSLLPIVTLPSNKSNCTIQLDSRFYNRLEMREVSNHGKNVTHWSTKTQFSQYSEYILMITPNASQPSFLEFNLYSTKQAKDAHIPIYIALAAFVSMALLWNLLRAIWRRDNIQHLKRATVEWIQSKWGAPEAGLLENPTEESSESHAQYGPIGEQAPVRRRFRSLDAFRGLCLVIMIFVNYGGGGYWFFDHSFWNGLTLADLVFPWFTWIIGTAICISLKSQANRGATKWQMSRKVARRTGILFALGLLLESSNGADAVDVSSLRIPGVLQRLAVSYAAVALIEVHFAQDYVTNAYKDSRVSSLRDLAPHWAEWIFMLGLVALHLLLTFMLHVPGCPKGYIGAGGLSEGGLYHNCTGGAAGYIDRWLFGENHIYQSPTCKEVYKTTVPYDPEGSLGTLTSIFMCFLGAQAGKILLLYDRWKSILRRLLIWGFITGMTAGILCRFHQNAGWIPVNKNLWSVSFVLGLAGLAFLLLALFYMLCDVWGVWSGAPFFFPGMNSIAIYIAHMVFENYFPIKWKVAEEHATLLPLHLWGTTFWTCVSALMYWKKVFIVI